MSEHGSKEALFDELASVGKALGSGKRLELLDLLTQGERTVEALALAVGAGVTTTSAHLQRLRQTNLVATRKAGTRVYYRLAGNDVAALYARLRQVAHTHAPDVEQARAAYLGPETAEVDREELLRRARTGEVTVLDVRPREEYVAGHIPDAVSIPLDDLTEQLATLPADQEIVAYCRGAWCVLAYEAVRLLTAHGHTARRLSDGMLEWQLAELPIATGTR